MLATHVWQQGIFARAPKSEPPRVGFPRHFDRNIFAPGATLPTLKQSYLARLARTHVPEDQRFGLADHVSVPLMQVEAQFTSALSTTVEGLFSRARSLRAAAETLVSGTPSGVFHRRSAGTSDSAVTAVAIGGASLATYNVDVVQLALAQQNRGEQLLSSQSPSRFTSGTHTFTVTADGATTPVSVTIAPGDSNLQALSRVQDAVNAAGTSVEASIAITHDVA
ncbi:MAG TPA: hypothetical protein VGW38_19915, partial [Chloroflexota bacterium]|nr:hypothetical protein [Chloroflexota bacterium]